MPDGTTQAQFTADRLTGLGGSDLGAILGLNPYRTPHDVWLEKTRRHTPEVDGIHLRHGQWNEQFIADEYTRATGLRTQRYNAMLRHPEAPLIGHVDRLVIPDGAKIASYKSEIRTDLGLECKTASAFAAGRDSEWGPSGTDQVPQSYLLQVAAYQALTGCERWDLAALIGNADLRIYHFNRDLELEGYLIEEASRWWRDYVVADTPPPPSSELEARQRWPGHTPGKVLDADPTLYTDLTMLARLKAEIRAKEKEEQALKDRILPALADAEVVAWAGKEIMTYRANKASDKTDWKALADELLRGFAPEDRARYLADYTTTQPGARVLRLGKALEA